MLAASLIGGLIGAALAYAAQTLLPRRAAADPRVAQLEQRLAALARDASDAVEVLSAQNAPRPEDLLYEPSAADEASIAAPAVVTGWVSRHGVSLVTLAAAT